MVIDRKRPIGAAKCPHASPPRDADAVILTKQEAANCLRCTTRYLSNSALHEAKRRLPLPGLLYDLGLGQHAKKSARCPFHDDQHNSFSIYQRDGIWHWKCFAGCGQGDEITLVERFYGISNIEAINRYIGLAYEKANIGAQIRPPATTKEFNWDDCVAALRESDLRRIAKWRGYREDTVRLLMKGKKIGIYKGCVAFPVEDHAGHVVGAHYRLRDGSWRYYPHGTRTAPFILGELAQAKQVHVFESQWDMLAFADRTSNYETPGVAFVATLGAANASLVKDRLPEGASVLAWPQNDEAGEKWVSDLSAFVPGLGVARVPASMSKLDEFGEKVEVRLKDMNDWTKAGADCDDLAVNKSTASDLASLLSKTVKVLQQNITFNSEHQAIVVALWIAHTHVVDRLNTTPYLHITSPVKRCGKSNLLLCLKYLASKAWHAVNPSVPVLYRKIERDCPTLLLDEADRSFEGGESGRQDFLAILNSGYKRGATVDRCSGANRDQLESFAVFCPKAFAGIGELPDTTQDRCLPIRLERQVRGRRRRFLEEHVDRELTPIRDRLARWAKTENAKNKLSVTILDHAFPESLSDRAVEVCDSLFKIAIAAGDDWYERIREATAVIFGGEADENQATLQLAAIRDAFRQDDRLSSSDLIDELLYQDESPFPNWWLKDADKKAIGKSLARILKPFGVKATKFRIGGEQVRGYERANLEPVWERYCTPTKNAQEDSCVLDVLEVSASVTPNSQLLRPGHLVSPELEACF